MYPHSVLLPPTQAIYRGMMEDDFRLFALGLTGSAAKLRPSQWLETAGRLHYVNVVATQLREALCPRGPPC